VKYCLFSDSGGLFQYRMELLGMIEKDRQWNHSRTSAVGSIANGEKLSMKK